MDHYYVEYSMFDCQFVSERCTMGIGRIYKGNVQINRML